MPELPEVETITREMREAQLVGLKIEQAIVYWERSVANQTPSAFCQRLLHQTILDIARRGKYIVFTLSKDTLLVHLRMTGKFFIDKQETQPHSHERIRLYLSDGRILRYEDQRKFGKWYLTNTEAVLQKIGLEPFSEAFTENAFEKILQGKQRQIKPFLLDQKFVAGLGNIYVDEALWMAKIHPARSLKTLSKKEIQSLHSAILAVLTSGIANTGTTLGSSRANYYSMSGRRGNNQHVLNVFRRDGLPCPRCHTIIQRMTLAQRGTHFCPHCQKES